MSDTNLPEGTGGDEALSVSDAADAISELLSPDDLEQEHEDQAHEEDESDEPDAEAEEGEEDESDAEEEGQDELEAEDGPDDIKGGRFAPDNAKVKLEDGSVVSIADLKRGTLFQADYTRKTQALAEERKQFESQHAQVTNYAQTLNQQRDFLLQAAQTFLPRPPDRSMIQTDIIGYQEHLAEYQEKMAVVQQLQQHAQAEQARIAQEQEAARQEAIKAESQRLLEAMPELKNPDSYQKFWNETVSTMAEYGFSQEELNQANDHRFYKVFRDLLKYRKARQQAPKVRKDMESKPVLKAGKRMDPKAKISREAQARSERLRQTGDFDAGVAAIMDLDL